MIRQAWAYLTRRRFRVRALSRRMTSRVKVQHVDADTLHIMALGRVRHPRHIAALYRRYGVASHEALLQALLLETPSVSLKNRILGFLRRLEGSQVIDPLEQDRRRARRYRKPVLYRVRHDEWHID